MRLYSVWAFALAFTLISNNEQIEMAAIGIDTENQCELYLKKFKKEVEKNSGTVTESGCLLVEKDSSISLNIGTWKSFGEYNVDGDNFRIYSSGWNNSNRCNYFKNEVSSYILKRGAKIISEKCEKNGEVINEYSLF